MDTIKKKIITLETLEGLEKKRDWRLIFTVSLLIILFNALVILPMILKENHWFYRICYYIGRNTGLGESMEVAQLIMRGIIYIFSLIIAFRYYYHNETNNFSYN